MILIAICNYLINLNPNNFNFKKFLFLDFLNILICSYNLHYLLNLYFNYFLIKKFYYYLFNLFLHYLILKKFPMI